MRLSQFTCAVLAAVCILTAGGPARAASASDWPLWDGHESTADYASRVKLPPTRSIDLRNGVTLDLVLIPAGQFNMGMPEPVEPKITVFGSQILLAIGITLALAFASMPMVRKLQRKKAAFSLRWLMLFTVACGLMAGGGARWYLADQELARYESEKAASMEGAGKYMRAHPVRLTQPFYIGKYPVTQAQYEALIGWNRSHFRGAQLPVETVSWEEAMTFCKKLKERLWDNELEASLPTEAQWEYACRAGTTTVYNLGNPENDLGAAAWYGVNSMNTTHPVGMKKSNAFGLYDMLGNVCEYCEDAWTSDYETLPAVDPRNEKGHLRVLRGCSWHDDRKCCRSAYRNDGVQDYPYDFLGFRVVVAPPFRTP